MKIFDNCNIGDIIYKTNFKSNEILKYEIIRREDSQYNNQIRFVLDEKRGNTISYVYEEFHTLEYRCIDVFKNNSYENERNLIGCDENIFWCADKESVNYVFSKYKTPILERLNELKDKIKSL